MLISCKQIIYSMSEKCFIQLSDLIVKYGSKEKEVVVTKQLENFEIGLEFLLVDINKLQYGKMRKMKTFVVGRNQNEQGRFF